MPRPNAHNRILTLFAKGRRLRTSEVAAVVGISRQAAQRHLRRLVADGTLSLTGRGPASRYARTGAASHVRFTLPRATLSEDRVWDETRARMPALVSLPPAARSIFQYAFTEMLNNAIDHSGSRDVTVRFTPTRGGLAFEIEDDGVGAFDNIRKRFKLRSNLDAVQDLSKGKVTTAPKGHTGEGIFFTSKVADLFEIDSGGLVWRVDNIRGDTTVAPAAPRRGTRVRFEAGRAPRRSLAEVFAEYTDDFEFSKTRTVVKLFAIGVQFVSRSEARRLCHGLERFREVILDFHGVDEVGQGFVDEVFRVWALEHPGTKLTPINMAPTVAFMVRRGLGSSS